MLALVAAVIAIGWLLYAGPTARQLAAMPGNVGSAMAAAAVAAATGTSRSGKKKHKGGKGGKAGAAPATEPGPSVDLAAVSGSAGGIPDSGSKPLAVSSGGMPNSDAAAPRTAAAAAAAAAAEATAGATPRGQQPGQGSPGSLERQQEVQQQQQQEGGGQQQLPPDSLQPLSLQPLPSQDPHSSSNGPSGGSNPSRRTPNSEGGGMSFDAIRSFEDETGAIVIGRLRVGPGVLGYGSAGQWMRVCRRLGGVAAATLCCVAPVAMHAFGAAGTPSCSKHTAWPPPNVQAPLCTRACWMGARWPSSACCASSTTWRARRSRCVRESRTGG